MKDAGDRLVGSVIAGRDVTQRVLQARALHALTAHLQTIREDEKTRIARDLHDDLGQLLTVLGLTPAERRAPRCGRRANAPGQRHDRCTRRRIGADESSDRARA
jgi:signal transduction histidine kinase